MRWEFKMLLWPHKLWALVLSLLVVMVALLVSLPVHTVNVASRTAQLVQFNEERALLATRWKGLTELAVDRVGQCAGDDTTRP